MKSIWFCIVMVAAIVLTVSTGFAAIQEEVWIETSMSGGMFSSGNIKLHGYVNLPDNAGDKKYPLLIINHGTPVSHGMARQTKYTYTNQASYFVEMGFVVVTFARRGYGKS